MSSTADAGPVVKDAACTRGHSGEIEDATTLIDGLWTLLGHREP
jgi:hypothetical protein